MWLPGEDVAVCPHVKASIRPLNDSDVVSFWCRDVVWAIHDEDPVCIWVQAVFNEKVKVERGVRGFSVGVHDEEVISNA